MSSNIHARITGDASDLKRALQDGGQAVEGFGRRTTTELRRTSEEAERTTGALRGVTDTLITFAAGGTVLGGLKLVSGLVRDFGSEVMSAQVQADKLRNTLTFAVGRDSAAREMAMLRDTSRELGIEFVSNAQQYARLAAAARGTAMEGRQTREVFEAIAQASVVMGMGAEESEGALRAVQQMMSKGKVQAEELRGQLGERLPGAFQIAARAMGVTTGELDKMLETGQVFAADFLPKFAAQIKAELGDSVLQASQSAQAGLNRYTNAVTGLKQSFAQSGVSAFIGGQMAILADGMASVSENIDKARQQGSGFTGQMLAGAAATTGFLNPLNAFSYSAQETGNRLDAATRHLAELQAMQKLPENYGNSFLPRSIADTQELIVALRQAQREKLALSGADDPRSQYPSRGDSLEREEKRQQALQVRLAAIRNKANGVKAEYVQSLNELQSLEQAGVLGFAERASLAAKLTEESYRPKAKSERTNPADAVFKSISERTAELRAEMSAQQNLTSAQKLASKVLDDLRTGSLKLTEAEKARMGTALAALLTEDRANTDREQAIKLAEENARIVEKNTTAAIKDNEARAKVVEAEQQANDKLREEIELIGLDETSRTRRLQIIEQEHIARLELDLVVARNIEGNEAQIAAIEREIAVRQQRIGLLGDKGQRDSAATWLEDRKKDADQLGEALTNSLMAGGKSFFDYLKDTARTTVLRPVISAVMSPVATAVSSFMNGGPGPGAASTSSGIGSLSMSAMGSMFGAGGLGGSLAAGAGWLTGATTLSGSLTAASSLMATGTGAGIMSGLGMAAGALGPIALGAMLLSSYTKGKGGPKTEAGYNVAGMERGDTAAAKAVADTITAGYAATVRGLGGRAGDLDAGVFYAMDNAGKGDSQTQLEVLGRLNGQAIYSRNSRLGGFENVARGQEALDAEITAERLRTIISAVANTQGVAGRYTSYLGATDLSGDAAMLQARLDAVTVTRQLDEAFRSLGNNISRLAATSIDASKSVTDLFGGMEQFSAAYGGYLENFYTEGERAALMANQVADAMAGLGQQGVDTIPEFRALVDGIDLTSEAGRQLFRDLMDVQDAFHQVHAAAPAAAQAAAALNTERDELWSQYTAQVDDQISELERLAAASREAAQATRAYRNELHFGNLSALTAQERTRLSFTQLQDLSQRSRTDPEAVRDLTGAAGNYLEGLFRTAGSRQEYAEGYWTVQQLLRTTEDSLDTQAQGFESQIDVLKANRDQLGIMIGLQATANMTLAEIAAKLSASVGARPGMGAGAAAFYTANPNAVDNPGAADLAYWNGEIERLGVAAAQQKFNDVVGHLTGTPSIPAFATGGDHTGGLRLVGERNWEIEATGPARIFNAEQISRAMLQGAANDDTAGALRELAAVIESRLGGAHYNRTKRALDAFERLAATGFNVRAHEAAGILTREAA